VTLNNTLSLCFPRQRGTPSNLMRKESRALTSASPWKVVRSRSLACRA